MLNKIVKSVQNGFHDVIHAIFGGALDFVSALAESIKENGGEILQAAAMEAVKAAEDSGGSGRDKFEAAFSKVAEVLTREGIPLVTNAINGAIESAVAQLKSPTPAED